MGSGKRMPSVSDPEALCHVSHLLGRKSLISLFFLIFCFPQEMAPHHFLKFTAWTATSLIFSPCLYLHYTYDPCSFFLFIPSMAESTPKIEIINSVRKSTSKQQFEPNGSTFLRWQWFWISVGLFLCSHSLVSAIEHKPKPGDLWDCRKALGYAFKYEFGLWFWHCPL